MESSEYPYLPSPEKDEYILWVNNNSKALGWSADACDLSPSHAQYNHIYCQSEAQKKETHA
jgi:hypothetical protein